MAVQSTSRLLTLSVATLPNQITPSLILSSCHHTLLSPEILFRQSPVGMIESSSRKANDLGNFVVCVPASSFQMQSSLLEVSTDLLIYHNQSLQKKLL